MTEIATTSLHGFDQVRKRPHLPYSCRPTKCGGCPFGGYTVGSRGPEDSPFVIVGESPGSNELYKGYPFVGPSGEMLEYVLQQAGLYEAGIEPYIVNALQCLPREKTIPAMQPAVHACQGRLHAEILKHPRKIILSLGASAAWTTTNNFGIKITQERGKLYRTPLASVGIVTAVHPAYLMRNGNGYPQWKRDVKYAVDLLLGNDPKAGLWTEPTWELTDSRGQYQTLLEKYRAGATHITCDIETGGRDKHGNSYGLDHQRGHILSNGFTSNLEGGRHVHIVPGSTIWDCEDITKEIMSLPNVRYCWQNGKFDTKFFRHEGVDGARVDDDTMLASYTLNENKGHDLDTIAWDFIGAANHKGVVDEWFKARGIPRHKRDYAMLPQMELLFPYQAYDISKTHILMTELRMLVEGDENSKKLYYDVLIPASEFLTKVEMKGLSLDTQRVEENDQTLLVKLQEVEEKIQVYARKHIGCDINIGSWQQLQRLLYDKMKLGPVGGSTDEEALIKIQRKFDHPIAGYLLTWRKIAKQRNTYVKPAVDRWVKNRFVPGWRGADGRVHCTYKLHGTTTGRLASSDPNMQNIPRDAVIRGQFVASPGKTLVECDLNQAELRCLALMSGDPTLLQIYTDPKSPSIHHLTSVAMFGEVYDDDQKMRAKAVNFGIVYGRSAPSLAEEFDISVREAEEYIRIWLSRYPVAAKFIENCRRKPHDQRTLINNFGRKKRWGLVSLENYNAQENEAANWPCQSTAHDITLLAGIEVQPVVKERWDADIVNEIHDALYFEVEDDPDVYKPMVKYVCDVMQRVPKDWGLNAVPFIAEAKQGSRWGRDYMHSIKDF